MTVGIFPIDLGFDRCDVLQSDGVIAEDAGAPDQGRNFARGLETASIDPRDVELIVITHGHRDAEPPPGEVSPGKVDVLLGEEELSVSRSWRRLLDNGATKVCPAHGKPFPADVIRRVLS